MAGWQDYNEQASFVSQFQWTDDNSPKRVAETYKTSLPVIVKVTSGYDGCDGMHEFAMDELYCLVDIKKQKRVVMTDINDRYISIPFDYHIKFHSVDFNNKPEGPARPLSEICPTDSSSQNVNLRVMFEQNQAVKFNDGADVGSKVQLGVIEFDEVFKERYLVCHPLQTSEILSDVVLIPIYVPISLSVAEGFVNSPPNGFSDWMRCIAASVKAFDTTNIKPCTEIVVFDESPAGDYTYINPVNLFQHSLKVTSPQRDPDDSKRYLNITQCKEKQRGRISVFGAHLPSLLDQGQGQGKDQGQGRGLGATNAAESPSSGPPLPPRNYPKGPSPDKDIAPLLPGPRKTAGSTSGQTKSPVTSPAPAKVTREVKDVRPSSPMKTTKKDVAADPSKRPQLPTPSREQVAPPISPLTGNATRIVKNPVETPVKVGSSGRKEPPVVSSKQPVVPAKGPEDYRIAESMQNKEKLDFSKAKPLKQCPPLINDCPPLIEHCSPQYRDNPSPFEDFAEDVDYETLDEAIGVTQQSGGSGGSGWKSLDDSGVFKSVDTSGWKSIEDVPVNLNFRSLTVEEICQCLELLKMERFSDQFRRHMVDGSLLLDLTNEALKVEFGMTLFDATKLMKFARDGWRPKTQ